MARGEEIRFPIGEGRTMRGYLALPDQTAVKAPGVVVIHEAFGLNDDIRRIADRFAENGYAALAPDLYDLPGLKVLCVLRAFRSLFQGGGDHVRYLEAARSWLAQREGVDGERVAAAGFCMGGGFAVLLAPRGTFQVVAPFYGVAPKDRERLRGACPVTAGYGEKDKFGIGHGRRLDQYLEELGVPHEVRTYPQAGHSFMNQHEPGILSKLGSGWPMYARYEECAAEDSWRRMLDFFAQHLGAGKDTPPGENEVPSPSS